MFDGEGVSAWFKIRVGNLLLPFGAPGMGVESVDVLVVEVDLDITSVSGSGIDVGNLVAFKFKSGGSSWLASV